jgi:hypothetical protein
MLTPPVLRLSKIANHSEETLVSRVELGLELGRVSARVALEHLSVVRHDLVPVLP